MLSCQTEFPVVWALHSFWTSSCSSVRVYYPFTCWKLMLLRVLFRLCRLGCNVQNYANRTECFRCNMPRSYNGKHTIALPCAGLSIQLMTTLHTWQWQTALLVLAITNAIFSFFFPPILFRLIGQLHSREKKKKKKNNCTRLKSNWWSSTIAASRGHFSFLSFFSFEWV